MKEKTPTGLDAIFGTLTRGSTGEQVKALQTYLIGMGHSEVKADGVFGPMTEAAVKDIQSQLGVVSDGKFGPKTLTAAKTYGSSEETPTDTKIPTTKAELDAYIKEVNKAKASDPSLAKNSQEDLAYAASTGDFSRILNEYGQPVSVKEQKQAMADAEDALAPGYQAGLEKTQADVEAEMQQQQADYDNYLAKQASQFGEDKTQLDQTAADRGVLFSGGRVQKEQNLGDAYSRDAEYNRSKVASNIASSARDFQYKYGNDAANNLSSYYKLGSQSYNPKVATGGATTGGLSRIYNPNNFNFDGTEYLANRANVNQRAAGLLWNKANKKVGTSINNQYK